MQYHTILFSTLILHQEVCIIETPDSLFFANKLWWKSHSMILLVLMNFSFTEWERIWVCKIQRRYLSYPISHCCVCICVCLCVCVCVFYYFRVGKIGSMYILGTINTGDSPSDDVCKRKLKVVNRKEMTRKTKISKLKPIWMLQIDENVSLILIW